jgi:hypothetical protein
MNPFSHMMNDEVFVIDKSGNRSGPYKTAFSTKNLIIDDESIDVEEGYKLARPLPGGKEDIYTIVETKFQSEFHGIPAHFSLTLQKDSAIHSSQQHSKNTTININNSQGIQVGDHNVQHIANSFSQLISEIEKSDASTEEKIIAKSKLKELITNPTVAAVLGGAVSGLLGLL